MKTERYLRDIKFILAGIGIHMLSTERYDLWWWLGFVILLVGVS